MRKSLKRSQHSELFNEQKTLDKGGHICTYLLICQRPLTHCTTNFIAKTGSYGFDTKALYYIKSYPDNRKQRVRVNSNFSSWQGIIDWAPQGSILGQLM